MKHWARWACVLVGAGLMSVSASRADEGAATAAPKKSGIVVDIRTDHIVLMDIALAEPPGGSRRARVHDGVRRRRQDLEGDRYAGQSHADWSGLQGRQAWSRRRPRGLRRSHRRRRDELDAWAASGGRARIAARRHEPGGDHFVTYGAFGMYFDSTDAGRTWTKRMVESEDFDRHISQVLPVGSSLFMVAESGTLARSDDGGATWTTMTSPYEGSYFAALANARRGAARVRHARQRLQDD